MIKKIKNSVKRILSQQEEILKLSKENEWANVYHDSIRGKDFLQEMPLNIGRWAGNYSFFYVLNRVLNDYKPKSILEFGLGESTKFIMAYLGNELKTTNHIVIEQNENWAKSFSANNKIPNNTEIRICPLEKIIVKGAETNSYKNLDKEVNQNFDLYVIDGPFGSESYSRYDIIEIARKLQADSEFIIMFDDYNREGEKETVADLLMLLNNKQIKTFCCEYAGAKSLYVIATERFKYATSL